VEQVAAGVPRGSTNPGARFRAVMGRTLGGEPCAGRGAADQTAAGGDEAHARGDRRSGPASTPPSTFRNSSATSRAAARDRSDAAIRPEAGHRFPAFAARSGSTRWRRFPGGPGEPPAPGLQSPRSRRPPPQLARGPRLPRASDARIRTSRSGSFRSWTSLATAAPAFCSGAILIEASR
jgi:hypothetical protein